MEEQEHEDVEEEEEENLQGPSPNIANEATPSLEEKLEEVNDETVTVVDQQAVADPPKRGCT